MARLKVEGHVGLVRDKISNEVIVILEMNLQSK